MHRDRPATARHRLGVIRRLYHWLAANEAVEVNPAVFEKAPPPPPKTRVWTAQEVQRIWISAGRLPDARRDFLRLITLLPLRRAELANTRVRDIRPNGPRLELVIEAGRAKNRVEHIMPLTGEARAIVERLMEDREPGRFPARVDLQRQTVRRLDGVSPDRYARFRASPISTFTTVAGPFPASAASTVWKTTPSWMRP